MNIKLKIAIGICSTSILIIFLVNPELTISSMLGGINLWATKILPALFPFFVLTKIISISGTFDYISNKLSPLTTKLYHTSGLSSYVFICSIVSGYPIGTKIISELYKSNKITNNEAKIIMSFTSTSGPLFIIGTVGIGLFQDKILGYMILLSHIISAILNGFIYRNLYKSNITLIDNTNISKDNFDIENIIYTSIISIIMVGAYISLFYMILCILEYYQIYQYTLGWVNNISPTLSQCIESTIYGLIEVTKGCVNISNITNISPQIKLILSSFIIGFGGLSIHMQSLIFIKQCNIKYTTFLLQKITHALISIIVSFIIGLVFL